MSAVEDLRTGVDELDRDIQRLVARRRDLSMKIQSLRLRGGGARHDLNREERVVASYVGTLGPEGAELAEAVLRLCRGPGSAEPTPAERRA
jgi:chorismate mutase